MKFWYNPNFLALLFLVIAAIPALKSLAIPGFYTSHDGQTHTARIAQYYQAIKDGQIPPRFAGNFYNGLGSPIFVYIYPLPYILGSFFHWIGFSFTNSFEIIMALGFVLSAIFCYLWLKELFKSEKAAFVGSLFYVWIPYRFLLIYVRASLSEHLAYTFLPLVLLYITKLKNKMSVTSIALTSLSLALLFLSQNLVVAFSTPVILGYALLLSLLNKSKMILVSTIASYIWGFAIASFVFLPTLFEKHFVRLEEIIKPAYADHFVTLKQLFRSPWGYGFDFRGTVNDQMSFQLGLVHLLILVLFLIFFVYQFVKFLHLKIKRRRISQLVDVSELTLAFYFFLILTLAVLLMIHNRFTLNIWQDLKLYYLIDIPWRFLGICTLSLAVISAYTLKKLKMGIIAIFLIILVFVANRNHLRINQSIYQDDQFFFDYRETATQYNEFTPIWRQTTRVPIGFDPQQKIDKIIGDVDIYNINSNSRSISFETDVKSQNATLRINKFYFPKTEVIIDQRPLKLGDELQISDTAATRLEKEQDSSGLVLVKIPQGIHQLQFKYLETPLRSLGNFTTLTSFFLALAAIVVPWLKKI